MVPFTLFMCFFSPVLPAFFVDPGWTCSLNIGPSDYRDQLSLQALKVSFKIVRKMKYPVTWDGTVKVWLDIIYWDVQYSNANSFHTPASRLL